MESTSVTLTVPGNDLMSELVGEQDALLRRVQGAFPGSSIHVRGNAITIDGEHAPTVRLVFDEVVALLQKGLAVDERTLDRAIDMVRADEKPSEVLTTEILRTSRGKPVRARSAGQKRYVEAVAGGIITFAVGPAGTGKSWLAVAMAVRALQAGQVDRIVLTRPLVEAGERVGFLPGDLMAKVDPYLRPLFDALYDMMDGDRVHLALERGQPELRCGPRRPRGDAVVGGDAGAATFPCCGAPHCAAGRVPLKSISSLKYQHRSIEFLILSIR